MNWREHPSTYGQHASVAWRMGGGGILARGVTRDAGEYEGAHREPEGEAYDPAAQVHEAPQ